MTTATRATNALLGAALALAGRGWPVFLLGRSKRPVANCPACRDDTHPPQDCACLTCHGFYAGTTEPHRIAAMVAAVPGGQLAVCTGTPSGLLVVDVDPAHGGLASLARLVNDGLTPPTARVVTGSGGLHLYYRHPGQVVPSRPLPGYQGVDIKADGGYVVAPPAIHPHTGRPYRWVGDGRPVEEMPPALVSACLPAPVAVVAAPAGPIHTRAAGASPSLTGCSPHTWTRSAAPRSASAAPPSTAPPEASHAWSPPERSRTPTRSPP